MDLFWWGLLLAARLLAPVLLIPALGGKPLVTPAKVALVALLAAALAPALAPEAAAPRGWTLVLAATREAAVGVVLAFAGRCVFLALEAGGRLVDEISGADCARSNDLLSGEPSSPFMQLKLFLAVLLFYSLGGPEKFLQAFIDSLRLLPLASPATESVFSGLFFLRLFSSAMETGLALALPATAAALGAELLLGAAGRFIPQLPLYFMSLPARYTLALALTAIVLADMLPVGREL